MILYFLSILLFYLCDFYGDLILPFKTSDQIGRKIAAAILCITEVMVRLFFALIVARLSYVSLMCTLSMSFFVIAVPWLSLCIAARKLSIYKRTRWSINENPFKTWSYFFVSAITLKRSPISSGMVNTRTCCAILVCALISS